MVKTYSIAEVADRFGVSHRTIRYYEEVGLIHPKRTATGQRIFTKKELTQLQLIFRGKKYGFKLDEIKEMVLLFEEDPTGREQLKRTIEYGEEKIAEVTKRLNELEQLKKEMEMFLDTFRNDLTKLEEEAK
ncbi:MerR family transcriptional regulator [Allobacillus sp. GCM10007491]|uniref:MerR family transcriptional regulator n=1 Tax=Allobacillus saliphilus TaxID=2912308 RepID=A0A941CUE0_9BACI|nr:MerR family transcriptional regulator [Allobacillus saliphilus]MBR7554128.1 MerR family transcriptional regulator [Allobacillus saliphilus]